MNQISAMKLSPYFKEFEEDALSWEEKLNRINALFDVWIDVQRRWVYLEGGRLCALVCAHVFCVFYAFVSLCVFVHVWIDAHMTVGTTFPTPQYNAIYIPGRGPCEPSLTSCCCCCCC